MEQNSKTVALDRTLGAVCHEIRTPLTALVGALNLLGEGSLGAVNPDQRGFIQVAIRNARRMQALVSSILASSRASRGDWPVDPVPANLARLAEAGIAEALQAAGGTREQIRLEAPEEPSLTPADPEGMTRIVKNLVANAIRFSAPGGTVRVVIRREPAASVLEVTDGGPGIPPEDRDWIFGRFHQVPHERGGRPRGGLGLGLFLSRAIAHAHGGEVACLSPAVGSPGPGPGTTFRVTLPLDPAARAAAAGGAADGAVLRVARPDGGPLLASQAFRAAEALRVAAPEARRVESPGEVLAVWPGAPADEVGRAATRAAAALGGDLVVSVVRGARGAEPLAPILRASEREAVVSA